MLLDEFGTSVLSIPPSECEHFGASSSAITRTGIFNGVIVHGRSYQAI